VKIECSGKTVLVTGGTRGIGKAIARLFAEANAVVYATGTNTSQVEKLNAAGSGVNYMQADFASKEDCTAFLDEIPALDIDILINNAGINKINLAHEVNDDTWDLIQMVNVRAPMMLAKKVIPGMLKRRWGRIVNITSIFGHVTRSKRISYSMSKFALWGMTKTLAVDYARDNILVNAVAPGFIDTELTRSILSEDEISELIDSVPMKRLGTAEEVAQLTMFLASEQNTFITGQNILIDGGFTSV